MARRHIRTRTNALKAFIILLMILLFLKFINPILISVSIPVLIAIPAIIASSNQMYEEEQSVFQKIKIKKSNHVYIRPIPVKRLKIETIQQLKKLDPYQFELFVAKIYKDLGYEVTPTPRVNDGGKDIILKKDNQLYYVECKRYEGSIGRPMIQKLVGACAIDGAKPIFVTTSRFTQGALKYGKEAGVDMVDATRLSYMIQKRNDLSVLSQINENN